MHPGCCWNVLRTQSAAGNLWWPSPMPTTFGWQFQALIDHLGEIEPHVAGPLWTALDRTSSGPRKVARVAGPSYVGAIHKLGWKLYYVLFEVTSGLVAAGQRLMELGYSGRPAAIDPEAVVAGWPDVCRGLIEFKPFNIDFVSEGIGMDYRRAAVARIATSGRARAYKGAGCAERLGPGATAAFSLNSTLLTARSRSTD